MFRRKGEGNTWEEELLAVIRYVFVPSFKQWYCSEFDSRSVQFVFVDAFFPGRKRNRRHDSKANTKTTFKPVARVLCFQMFIVFSSYASNNKRRLFGRVVYAARTRTSRNAERRRRTCARVREIIIIIIVPPPSPRRSGSSSPVRGRGLQGARRKHDD